MDIHLEATEAHTVQAYSSTAIQINSMSYKRSLIVSKTTILSDLAITDIQHMEEHYINLLLQLKPEIILIGHQQSKKGFPMSMMHQLAQQRIGVECMSLGAACRTYNVLLSERRAVVGFLILVPRQH